MFESNISSIKLKRTLASIIHEWDEIKEWLARMEDKVMAIV